MEIYEEEKPFYTTYETVSGWHGLVFGTVLLTFGISGNNIAVVILAELCSSRELFC